MRLWNTLAYPPALGPAFGLPWRVGQGVRQAQVSRVPGMLVHIIELGACRARHEFEGRGSCLGAHDASDDACGIAAVLGPVLFIDLVIEVRVDLLHEGDVFLDATRADVPLVTRLGAPEPGAGASVHASHIQVVADADAPDDHRVAQGAVTAE